MRGFRYDPTSEKSAEEQFSAFWEAFQEQNPNPTPKEEYMGLCGYSTLSNRSYVANHTITAMFDGVIDNVPGLKLTNKSRKLIEKFGLKTTLDENLVGIVNELISERTELLDDFVVGCEARLEGLDYDQKSFEDIMCELMKEHGLAPSSTRLMCVAYVIERAEQSKTLKQTEEQREHFYLSK